MKLTPTQEVAFWAFVEKTDGCWLWRGNARGLYGIYSVRTSATRITTVGAHRQAFELTMHPIPRGYCVMHTCDVPLCVNPAHLRVGTQMENVADAVAKGRHPSGERNGHAKLTWAKVREIRAAIANGATNSQLAAAYSVDRSLISLIGRNRIWKES